MGEEDVGCAELGEDVWGKDDGTDEAGRAVGRPLEGIRVVGLAVGSGVGLADVG